MMKPVITATLFLVTAGFVTAPAALARTGPGSCSVQAKSIKEGQAEAKELKAERSKLQERVELAGEEWDAAKQMSQFGEDEAQKAVTAKAEYQGLKSELLKLDRDLQNRVSDLNSSVARYNQVCAKK